LYSPIIGSIKVIRSGKVKRSKLYYLRDRKGKSARIAEKIKKKIGIDVSETGTESQTLISDNPPEKKIKDTEQKKETIPQKDIKKEKLKEEKK